MSRNFDEIKNDIIQGKTAIGIELGSTRIKAVLIGSDHSPIASGGYDWENSNIDGVWTYGLDEVWKGLQGSYQKMVESVLEMYQVRLSTTGAIGISAMMHGYLAFDRTGKLLTPFRTWRNNITGPASEELFKLFNYPIPQRWSIAHLYQAILNGEAHVPEIAYITTLAGYIHWQLTGRKVLGIGDASGMFPIDLAAKDFNPQMMAVFNKHVSSYHFPWKIEQILPEVLSAGTFAGALTANGARLLDGTGQLQAGIPLCPPEGDAGTGMVATNSVAVRTGNVSAGTSVFAMIVLEKDLSKAYGEIDLVTTPDGSLVAMVHSNNCTSDYDAWIGLFGEAVKALGMDISKPKLYDTLLGLALTGDHDCGGLLSYGYLSGEHITGFSEGRPLFVRSSRSHFNLANFMRVNLFTALGALRTGLDILFENESVQVDEIRGHGGFFKAKEVGQRIMAAATGTPISIMETAGEGGAWGIALLAAYMAGRMGGRRRNMLPGQAARLPAEQSGGQAARLPAEQSGGQAARLPAEQSGEQATEQSADAWNETLPEFLNNTVFVGKLSACVAPDPKDLHGFAAFMKRYTAGLAVERAAVENLK